MGKDSSSGSSNKKKKLDQQEKQSWTATLDDNCEPRDRKNADLLLISKDCSKEQKQRDDLQQQYQSCAANFPLRSNTDKNLGPYDIRKHKQYNLLLESIQREYTVTKKDPNAPPTPTCVPFQTTDIRTHKDYPKMVQYIYDMASKKFSDITANPSYAKVVEDIEKKALLKCPAKEEIQIQQHPQYNQLVQSVVKKTMQQYGDPVPGSNPVSFQRCSQTVNNCLQKFKPAGKEGFYAATATAPNNPDVALNRIDPFDIQNHSQYRTLLATLQKECDAKLVKNSCPNRPYPGPGPGRGRGGAAADITTHPDINRYVLKASLPTSCLTKEGFLAGGGGESVADIKDTSAKMLKLNILDKPSTKVVADIYHNVVAVERGQQKLSKLVINNNNNNNKIMRGVITTTPPIVQDLQKMLAHKVEIAANQKQIKKIQKKAAQSMEQFRGNDDDADADADAGALTYMMENRLEAAKARIDNYAFKNARLREEILLLRKMCNERIMNLWNETQSLRFKQKDKERTLRHKEAALEKTQGVLEARDQRISEQQRTQQDKFVFFNSQVRLYRSVSERYKEELETLKRALQTQNTQAGQDMSRTQDMCAQRVEQYRKMYEQSLKLLQELRAKAAETPAVTDKINQLQGNLTQAVGYGYGSDSRVMGAFARVGQNMSSLEQSIQGNNNTAEDMMWYNNKATGDYASV